MKQLILKTVTPLMIVFVLSCLLPSCGDSGNSPPSTDNPTADSTIVIDQLDFKFKFEVPKELILREDFVGYLNESTGEYEITIGDKFQLNILNDLISLDDFKAELMHDQLFTYKFHENEDDMLVYQAILPTGEEYYYNLALVKHINDHHYFITSRKGVEFSLMNVDNMNAILSTIKPLD